MRFCLQDRLCLMLKDVKILKGADNEKKKIKTNKEEYKIYRILAENIYNLPMG